MPRYGELREDGRIWDGGWRTPEQFERRKEKQRERKRKPEELQARRDRNKKYLADPENREKHLQKQRERYHANRERNSRRKTEWRRRNKERANEYQRAYYSANKSTLLPRILETRLRRNPLIRIKSIIDSLKRGEGEFHRDLERVIQTLAELCEGTNENQG